MNLHISAHIVMLPKWDLLESSGILLRLNNLVPFTNVNVFQLHPSKNKHHVVFQTRNSHENVINWLLFSDPCNNGHYQPMEVRNGDSHVAEMPICRRKDGKPHFDKFMLCSEHPQDVKVPDTFTRITGPIQLINRWINFTIQENPSVIFLAIVGKSDYGKSAFTKQLILSMSTYESSNNFSIG